MTGAAHQKAEMKKNKKDKSPKASGEEFTSELREPRWAVVTFESCAVSGQTYDEAFELLKKLEGEKVSGLCIVSDEAAKRIVKSKKRLANSKI